MFLRKDGIANYADDNTPLSTGNRIQNIISGLEQDSDITNPDKYHVPLGEISDTQLIVEIFRLLGVIVKILRN